jgi:hypothetical protein
MEIKKLACELESWAQEKGWKTVTQLITPHHFGDLLQSLDDVTDPDEYARRLHNNKQIIQRAFRNDTPNYLKQAEALSYAIRAAIDNELEQKDCMHYRAASEQRVYRSHQRGIHWQTATGNQARLWKLSTRWRSWWA